MDTRPATWALVLLTAAVSWGGRMKVRRWVAVTAVLLSLGCTGITANKPSWSVTGRWVGSGMTLQITGSTTGYPPLDGWLTMADGVTLRVGGYQFPALVTLEIYANPLASFVGSMEDANHLSGTLDGHIWTRTPVAFTRAP